MPLEREHVEICREHRSGVTLVELLLTLSILLIVVGVALPALGAARAAAIRSKCARQVADHMRVLGLYACDYKDAWPYPFDHDRRPPRFLDAGTPPLGLDWYCAAGGLWQLPVLDAYHDDPFAEPLVCPADREVQETIEWARSRVSATGVPMRGTLSYRLSMAMFLDAVALDPAHPTWSARFYRGTLQSDVVFPSSKAALFEARALHERPSRQNGTRTGAYHLMTAGADGAVSWRDAQSIIPGVLMPGLYREGSEAVFRELRKLDFTPSGVCGRDW